MNCGEKISDLRKKNGMTQDDLGKAMNVSYQAVSKWERDESQPDFETMSKIAKLFNVPLGYFEENGEIEFVEKEETKATTKTEAKETPEKAEPAANPIGACTVCGKMLKEGEAATCNPKIVCKPCAEREKKEQEAAAKKAKEERQLALQVEVDKVVGHGFNSSLVVSLILALLGYVGLTALAFKYSSAGDAYIFGLLLLCPLVIFGVTHVVAGMITELRDIIEDDETAYTRNLSLIIGACFSAVNIALFLVLYLVYNDFYFLIFLGAGAVVSFTFVSQFLWGGVVKQIFTAGGFTFKMPGFIFSLDIDSIVWMIVVKFFLGIFSALLLLVTTLLVASIAMIGSVFTFIPSVLWKTGKDAAARNRLKTENTEI